MDDVERLLRRQDESDDDASRDEGSAGDGTPTFLGKTTTITTYPTTAARFYGVIPQDVTGTDTEGSTGTLTALTGTILALNLGGAIPPSGTAVICFRVDHRWCFVY